MSKGRMKATRPFEDFMKYRKAVTGKARLSNAGREGEMNGILKSMRTMFRTALAIDRRSLLICLAYNLIKQLMNVFYGVYFLRMILAGLDMAVFFLS